MTARPVLVVLLIGSIARAAPRASEQDLIDIITIQPRSQRAPWAALELLDRLNANGRTDELAEWVDRMLAMPRLLDGRDPLVAHLRALDVQLDYRRVRLAFGSAIRAKDREALRAACDGFVELADISTRYAVTITVSDGLHVATLADEATYNAGVCFVEVRDLGAASRHLAAVKNPALSQLAWRHIVTRALRAPYAWLTD